ncbi:MAG TPA: DUF371 domain-containing protein [Methanoregulaceae archaeon]|nr:DUF371 domain-containing protein [Methanoregulaceae archaeon]
MKAVEVITARGHPLVRALHRTTFEVTKEHELTPGGDCIIAVAADKGAKDLSPAFRTVLRKESATLKTTLLCEGYVLEVHSVGGPGISLLHPTDLVWRRSMFCCDRTVGNNSDAVALSIPREMISCLRDGAQIRIELTVECPD